MRIFHKLLFLFGWLLAAATAYSQELFPAVQRLKNYCELTAPVGYSPRLSVLTLFPKGNVHYLFPLYHGLRDEQKFRRIYSDKGYYDEMSQYFAFAGDYETALQYLVKGYDTIDFFAAEKLEGQGGRKEIYKPSRRRQMPVSPKIPLPTRTKVPNSGVEVELTGVNSVNNIGSPKPSLVVSVK